MTEAILKTIKVSDQNHRELTKLGGWGETMDEIVSKLLDYYKKGHNK